MKDKLDHPFTVKSFEKVIPEIHKEACKVLSALVLCAKGHLLPHASRLSIVLIQKLRIYTSKKFVNQIENFYIFCRFENLDVFKEICKTISFYCSTLGTCMTDLLCQEVLPLLLKHLVKFNELMASVSQPKKQELAFELNEKKKKKTTEKRQDIITIPILRKTYIVITGKIIVDMCLMSY